MSKFEEYFKNYHSNNEAYAEMIARDAWDHQQARIDELEADLTHWKQDYWKQADRLAEYDSIFVLSSNDDLEVLCFKKEKEIERLKTELEKALRGEK